MHCHWQAAMCLLYMSIQSQRQTWAKSMHSDASNSINTGLGARWPGDVLHLEQCKMKRAQTEYSKVRVEDLLCHVNARYF